jgi:hypothetical protein
MFRFTTNPTINISFNGQATRQSKKVRIQGGEPEDMLIYSGQEPVSGTVDILVPSGKKIDHLGIKIEMIGHIGTLPFHKCMRLGITKSFFVANRALF